jgi:hypothetical protein
VLKNFGFFGERTKVPCDFCDDVSLTSPPSPSATYVAATKMADRSFSWVSAESHVVVTDQRFVLRGCNTDVDYPGWKPLEEFLLPLQGATDIQELRLVNCALTGTATRLIVGNLLDKAHLCRLDLSHNNIQHLENGCAAIGRLLSLPTPSLMYLKLDWNNLSKNEGHGS